MPASWEDALAKFALARGLACNELPYLSARLLALIPIEARGLGTLAIDERMVVAVDPEYAVATPVEALASDIVHEAEHPARDHHARLSAIPNCNRRRGNWAADAEINDDLAALGSSCRLKPSPDYIYPKTIGCENGGVLEEYYQKGKYPNHPAFQGNDGDGEQGEDGSGQQDGQGQGKPGQGGRPGIDKPGAGRGWDGPCSVPGQGKAVTDAKETGRSEAEVARINQVVAEAIKQEAQRGRGNVPAGWLRWADSKLRPPKIPWPQKLAKLMRVGVAWKAGQVDYRYNRLSRRQAAVGYGAGKPIMPCLRAPVPNVACVLDLSGSMGQSRVQRGLSEIAAVIKTIGCEVTFLANDAAVHEIRKVKNVQELVNACRGGGGTDFAPAFKAIEKMKDRPNIVVFVTDADGPCVCDPPVGVRVIWVVIPYTPNAKPHPWGPRGEFGEFVYIEDDPGDGQ